MIADESTNSNSSSQTSGLWRSVAVLTAVLALAAPAFIWYGYSHHGMAGVIVALIAAGVCWLAASAALICTCLLQGPQTGAQGMLLGMLIRMGLPLGVGILLSNQGGALAEAGAFGMILVYYLLALTVETLLLVRIIASSSKVSKAS